MIHKLASLQRFPLASACKLETWAEVYLANSQCDSVSQGLPFYRTSKSLQDYQDDVQDNTKEVLRDCFSLNSCS